MIDNAFLFMALAPTLKIIVPAMAASLFIRYLAKKVKKFPRNVTKNETTWTLDLLMSLEWKRYEEICKELLQIEHKGHFKVNVTQIGADGGIDLKVTDSKNKVVAIGQCKAWNSSVGVSLIRELYGVMASEQVENGYFFTTSFFSQEAIQFAHGKKLKLIDGKQQIKTILSLSNEQQTHLLKIATKGDYKTPTCPNCDKKMIKRDSKRGAFWGCQNYPRCKTTLHVRKS